MLNPQQAVQTAINLGAHVVAAQELELPAMLREIFVTLERHRLISAAVSQQMRRRTFDKARGWGGNHA